MLFCFKKNLLPSLITLSLASNVLPAVANIDNDLPDIGTTAGDTLSINQELAIGDFYMRQLRASAPIINDPLLNKYINNLGQQLVFHSRSVKMPFHFFLIQNDEINAFTLFGGNVLLNSMLFHYVDNESQLASVIAHEISHVTQRHLARAIEYQKHNTPLTWFNALSSIILAIASPQVGMAALTGALAGAQQERISFTQQNEQEADRIGIQVLQRAGFDPEAMPDFLKKLVDESRFALKPPEILLTHPLPDTRLADVRNRVNQMKQVFVPSSQDFYMAKVRVLGMFATGQNWLNDDLLISFSHGNGYEKVAAQYGRAVVMVSEKKFAKARAIVAPLLAKQPNNIWYLDLMTDIDIGLKKPQQAINRLQAMKNIKSIPALQINLANAYMEAKQPAHASKLLYRYTWENKDDPNGWNLLAQASAAQNLTDEKESAQAESLALVGQLEQAIHSLSIASATVPLGSLKQARYDARIDQLRQLQQRLRQYKNSSKGFS